MTQFITGSPALKRAVEKLRDDLVEGIVDRVSLPEVSSINGMAAHEVLGCPMYTALVQLVVATYDMPASVREAAAGAIAHAVEGMAYRLITEDSQVIVREYGTDHVGPEDWEAVGGGC